MRLRLYDPITAFRKDKTMPENQLKRTFAGKDLAQTDLASALVQLLAQLPDVYFFVKDGDCRLVAANPAFVERVGAGSEDEILGRRSSDFDPPELARAYERDDREVMRSGCALMNRVELNRGADGTVNWFVTCKVPLCAHDGSITGVVGLARDVRRTRAVFESFASFDRVLEYVAGHYAERMDVSALARIAGLSRRPFERRFRKAFGVSPWQFLIRYRVHKACRRLIESTDGLARIAADCGFYDHSAFTRAFTAVTGTTPKSWRHSRGTTRF
jgi:PAS domain S-box-containing protein